MKLSQAIMSGAVIIALFGVSSKIINILFSSSTYDLTDIGKLPFGKGASISTLIYITMAILTAEFLFLYYCYNPFKEYKSTLEVMQAVVIIIEILIGSIVLIISRIKLNNIRNEIYSCEKFDVLNYNKKASILKSVISYSIFIIVCIIFLIIYFGKIDTEKIDGIFALAAELYISFFLFSYLFNVIISKDFKKYIISTDEFESGSVLALVVSETSDEILIKCEDSYPIILPKSKISGYIDVTELEKDKVNCLMGKFTENVEAAGKDTLDYKGYYIGKKDKDA